MPLPSPKDVAARTRAALAYANIKHTAKGKPVSVGKISQATMARIVSTTSPRGVKSIEELEDIADACRVPLAFLRDGFSPPVSEDDARVLEIEERLDAVAVLLPLLLERLGSVDGQGLDPSVAEALERARGKTG